MLRRRIRSVLALVAILAVLPLKWGVYAQPTSPKVIASWSGVLTDGSLHKLRPAEGYITNQKDFKRLWKAWKPNEKKPKIDFTNQFVLVYTGKWEKFSPGFYMQDGDLQLTGKVDSSVKELPSPAFSYHLLVLPREGIKTIGRKAIR